MLKLFNTATGKVEALPNDRTIGIYVCGITPYDTTHLGHAFTFLAYDVLIRYLRHMGKRVKYVQNVTDIDDDILIRAKAKGENWKKLGDRETRKYLRDMKALGWIKPDYYVRATDHIGQIIKIVKKLLEKRFAYEVKGSVYFSVKKDPQFGKRLEDLTYDSMLEIANERGNYPEDPNKRDPLDFILWQAAKEGEPFWKSPWGKGRPGWHIECSAMSTTYLGQPLTIHGGGSDLKFPHHESEISQSEKAFGKPFVKHWLHTAMVYCEGKKMSKSLGNMIFVHDLLKKYSTAAIRWYLFSHHYRSDWEFDWKDLDRAKVEAENFLKKRSIGPCSVGERDFFKALEDDLDTLKALRILVGIKRKDERLAKKLAEGILGIE